MLRLVVIAIALAACGDHAGAREPATREAGALRVLSYNLNFGLAGEPTALRAIAAVNADLVFLQETNDVWQSAIEDGFQRTYPHRRFEPPDRYPAGGMGVLSRFPIVSTHVLPSHGGMFFAWRIVLDTSHGRIQVLNVHLRPPMSDGGSWVVGYFSTRPNRLREIEYHLTALDRTLPTLIVGDFNEEADGLAMRRLAELGYHDAIAQFAGRTRTWEWPVASGVTLRFQLDHIMYDERFVAVGAQVFDAGLSDHKPIWADFVMSP